MALWRELEPFDARSPKDGRKFPMFRGIDRDSRDANAKRLLSWQV